MKGDALEHTVEFHDGLFPLGMSEAESLDPPSRLQVILGRLPTAFNPCLFGGHPHSGSPCTAGAPAGDIERADALALVIIAPRFLAKRSDLCQTDIRCLGHTDVYYCRKWANHPISQRMT